MLNCDNRSCLLYTSNGGAYHKNENISIHWSVGEVAVQTYKTSNVTLTEGFYQGVLLVTPTKEVYNTYFTIYPNPTAEKIFIRSEEVQISEVQIFDVKGSLVFQTNQLSDGLDVTTFPCGTYVTVSYTHLDVYKRQPSDGNILVLYFKTIT